MTKEEDIKKWFEEVHKIHLQNLDECKTFEEMEKVERQFQLLLTMKERSLEQEQYEPYEVIDDYGNTYIVKDGKVIKQ